MTDRDTTGRGRGSSTFGAPAEAASAGSHPTLEPFETGVSFKHKAYVALKNAIVGMDVYHSRDEIRLDERKLAQDFGISRTPVREAMAQLESEGFVRSVPRRGRPRTDPHRQQPHSLGHRSPGGTRNRPVGVPGENCLA